MSPKLSKEPLRLPPNTRVGALIFMVPSKNYRLSFGQGRDGIAYKSFCGTVQSADETGATLEFLGMTRKIDKSKFFYKDRSLSLQIKLTDFLDPTYEPTGVESLKPGDIIAVYNTYSYEIVQVRAVRAHPYRPGTLIDIDKHYFDKANVYTVPGFPYPIVRKRHFLH